ncbi:hypothetical protein L1887_46951 [Cichorium endivia]|nr:hypothetical protein L1887_46951 [Cichorium endivia]
MGTTPSRLDLGHGGLAVDLGLVEIVAVALRQFFELHPRRGGERLADAQGLGNADVLVGGQDVLGQAVHLLVLARAAGELLLALLQAGLDLQALGITAAAEGQQLVVGLAELANLGPGSPPPAGWPARAGRTGRRPVARRADGPGHARRWARRRSLHGLAVGGLGRQAKAEQGGDQGQAVDGHLHVCLPRLEARVDLELENVDGEWRAIHLVGAHPARGAVDVVGQAVVGADHVALGVGAPEVEAGVVEAVRQGIGLDVLVAGEHLPVATAAHLEGIAEGELDHPGVAAALDLAVEVDVVGELPGRTLAHVAFGVGQVADVVALQAQLEVFRQLGIPHQVQVEDVELGGQADVLRLRGVGRVGRVEGDVTQQEQGVALLHEGRSRAVAVARRLTGPGFARRGAGAGDIVEAVVGQGTGQAVVLVEFPGRTDLDAVQPLVVAAFLVETVGGRSVGAVLHRERAEGPEQNRVSVDRERVGDAAAADVEALGRLPGDVALVEPDVLLAEAATEGLGGRHRAVVGAGGQADAGAPVLRQLCLETEAGAQAQRVLTVFAGVEQRWQGVIGVRLTSYGPSRLSLAKSVIWLLLLSL